MKRISSGISLILLNFFYLTLSAQIQDYNVFFKNGTFTPAENKGVVSNYEITNTSVEGFVYGFIQFYEIPNQEQRNQLHNIGIELGEYIKRNTYAAVIPQHNFTLIQNLQGLRSFFVLPSTFKIRKGTETVGIERINLCISIYKNANSQAAISHLKSQVDDINFISITKGIFVVNIRREQIHQIVELPYIQWVEEQDMTPHLLDISSINLHKTNILKSTLTGQRGLSGNGVAIGIFDGIVYNHIDFANRLTIVSGSSVYDHSTEIAGLFAGAGNRNPIAIGHAHKADIYSWEITNNIINDIDSGVIDYNMMIANHSYFIGNSGSCTNRGEYDIVSYYFDTLAAKHPSLLQVFAAGNHRANNCIAGGYRTVFEGLQSSKNGMTIGSVTAIDGNSSDHSYGPTLDGRIKPDVVARGVSVYSSITGQNYTTVSGTSFSTPNTGGTATLLYEHYRALNSGKDPATHTIKAILMNTATDLGNAGPDFIYGYGRIDGYKAAKVLENKYYLVDSIAHQDSLTDSLFISGVSKTKEIRFMLAWAEDPTPLPSAMALINDLDLFLIDPNFDTIRPLVPDYTNPSTVAGEQIDTLNNNEQVVVSNVIPGYYKVVVLGKSIPAGKVGYTLTWQETEPYLELTYPFGGEKWLPPKDAATAQIIAWDGYDLTGTISVEFSDDSGSTWNTLTSGLANTTRYYVWNNASPTLYTGQALIRVSTTGGMSSQNSRVFTIMSNPLNTGVSSIPCSQQVTLYWKSTVATDTFRIFQLIGEEMTEIAKTTDTFYIVTGLTNGTQYWFALSIIDQNNVESIRSWAQPFTPIAGTIPASVNTQPTNQKACRFSDISFNPSFNGTPTIYYQWQRSTDGGATWFNIVGETSASLSITSIDSGLMTNLYRNSFYNACGGLFYTNNVSVIADSIPLKPTIGINPLTVCKDTIEFSYPKGLVNLNYDWKFEDAEYPTLSGLNLDNPTNQWVYPTLPGIKEIILKVTFPGNNCSNADTTTANIGCIALPIEWLSFSATAHTNSIILQWQTANEFNNDYFTILKSLNLTDWQAIGTKKSAGNSYSIVQYLFNDEHPVNGVQYYKLQQTDIDNYNSFSKVVQVLYQLPTSNITINPNPVNDWLYFISPDKTNNIYIKDITGKVIRYYANAQSQINVSDLANGVYFIEIESEGRIFRSKLLKQ